MNRRTCFSHSLCICLQSIYDPASALRDTIHITYINSYMFRHRDAVFRELVQPRSSSQLVDTFDVILTCIVLICGNKMPTRCNRGFYCRSYCLLMFRASLCPLSGAQEYYTVVAACGISCCGFSSSCSGVELRFMRPVCRMLVNQHPANRTHNPQLHTRPAT